MAVIRESLVLEDRFSSVFSAYLNLGRQIASNMRTATETQEEFTAAAAQSGTALASLSHTADSAASRMEDIRSATGRAADASGHAADKQDRLNRSMRSGAHAADGLVSRLKTLAAAYLGLRSAQAFAGLSDTWIQTTARLDRMNDGRQTTPQIQDMLFDAAQ